MKIQSSDPDISGVYHRYQDGIIDLQPDFQRDLVWNLSKKQTLIDTILRGWHFPPIFLVAPLVGERLDVLDGQQRLNAIFEFIEGRFPVNGNIEPFDKNLKTLHGLRFHEIPQDVKSRFLRYPFRVCELYDYREEEPYELFFRLNQGSVLTAAEKRNTLYGPVREQVKRLVLWMDELEIGSDTIGFNNNRLAYEDVVSRLLYALATRSLGKKITDQMLVDMYRGAFSIDDEVFDQAREAISNLAKIVDRKVKLSKPTLFTWLLILSLESIDSDFFYLFDAMRKGETTNDYEELLINIFQEKSSTSVNDAVPVQLRLLVIYLIGISRGYRFSTALGQKAALINEEFLKASSSSDENLVKLMHSFNWSFL
jgi:hypothetical protein